jgi:hypothetical protein
MKLTLINKKVNFGKTQIIAISPEEIEFLKKSDLILKKHKKYLIRINYRIYQIICPIMKNEKGEYVVIIPAFKYPNSNIPIFVHFYAIGLYLSSGESMRKVANKVKKMFGMGTFSHTTISRTLKKMISSIEENKDLFINKNKTHNMPQLAVRKHWGNDYIKKANILLSFVSPVLAETNDDIAINGTKISYEFFNKNKKYCA